MSYLLDTHVLLWWLDTPNIISKKARDIMQAPSNRIYVSTASFWEIAIKQTLGRLTIPHNILEITTSIGFQLLPIMPEEGLGVSDLPLLHQDPFDRLLIVQSKIHHLTFITRDAKIMGYDVPYIEA